MRKGLQRVGGVVVLVLVGVFAVDFSIGRMMDNILPRISNQGDTGKTYFSLNEVATPVVIVGSSRAAHHYVSPMIEETWGKKVYNVGRDGCFFSYNCCVINSILDRYVPDVIVWEVDLESLYEECGDPLENLYPYFGRNKWVTSVIKEDEGLPERISLCSNLYRYNSNLHRILGRYLTRRSFGEDTLGGYAPLPPKKLKNALVLQETEDCYRTISGAKTERFKNLVERAKKAGVTLVVVDSPKFMLRKEVDESARLMKQICDSYGTPCFDNTQLEEFLENPGYFNDKTHLNDIGAKVYSSMFIKQVGLKVE